MIVRRFFDIQIIIDDLYSHSVDRNEYDSQKKVRTSGGGILGDVCHFICQGTE